MCSSVVLSGRIEPGGRGPATLWPARERLQTSCGAAEDSWTGRRASSGGAAEELLSLLRSLAGIWSTKPTAHAVGYFLPHLRCSESGLKTLPNLRRRFATMPVLPIRESRPPMSRSTFLPRTLSHLLICYHNEPGRRPALRRVRGRCGLRARGRGSSRRRSRGRYRREGRGRGG